MEGTYLFGDNFNSIKVRLKLSFVTVVIELLQFQFHKGTIKTLLTDAVTSMRTGFQFHKGTIKTNKFNEFLQVHSTFQFHKGTIKTLICTSISFVLNNFNSIKVRLKRFDGGFNDAYSDISIP